jgi:hypothetical protein
VHDDVFDDHDGVVDHETHSGGESAESHQVEALAHETHGDQRDRDGGGDYERRYQRAAPVPQEENQNDGGENQSDQNRIADATDGIAD